MDQIALDKHLGCLPNMHVSEIVPPIIMKPQPVLPLAIAKKSHSGVTDMSEVGDASSSLIVTAGN